MLDLIISLPWYKKLEVLRAIKGWTTEETAIKCSTGRKVYWDWEKGNRYPMRKGRKALSEAFGIDEDEIFKEVRVCRKEEHYQDRN